MLSPRLPDSSVSTKISLQSSQKAQEADAQGVNNLDPEGTQDERLKNSKSSAPTATRIDFLHKTWLDSERELLELKAREGKGNGEALAAAQERRDVLLRQLLVAAEERRNDLWQQLLGEWSKNWKRKDKPESQPKATTEAQPDAQSVAPVEQSSEAESEPQEPQDLDVNESESEWPDSELLDLEEVDETVTLSELGGRDEFDVGELSEGYEQDESVDSGFELEPEAPDLPEVLDEEPPRKRSRLQASQNEARPSSPGTNRKVVPYTEQQKDHIRALICNNLGTRSLPAEKLEPVAQAAGLTTNQVRVWIKDFHRYNPDPTLEQAMAWRVSSHRDVLKEWLTAHRDHPYPSLGEKKRLAHETGKTLQQVDKWFRDARCSNELASNRNFDPDQIATLCASFEENIYPSAGEKQRLESDTGLSAKQVHMWFTDQRRRTGLAAQKELPTEKRTPLFAWLHANMEYPHPSADKKKGLAEETGLTFKQVQTWFQHSRERITRNQGKKEYEGRCPCCGVANV